MREIVILGAGGFAREVAFLIEDINRVSGAWKIRGFIDRDSNHLGEMKGKYPIVGVEDDLFSTDVAVVIGIGNPAILESIETRFQSMDRERFPTLIHPSVIYDHDTVRFGVGNVIAAGTILTCDISVGSFNIINLNCTIGHDVFIGNANVINPGCNISGAVRIGSANLIGTGAQVLQNLAVGSNSTVGAGSVVTRDVLTGTTVVGIPAKPRTK